MTIQDEYAEITIRAWDSFSDAIKHQSRDWMPGFPLKPKPYGLSLQLAREQNATALQAAQIQYPLMNNQPATNFNLIPAPGMFSFLGI